MIDVDHPPVARPVHAAARSRHHQVLVGAVADGHTRRRWTRPAFVAAAGAALVVTTAAGAFSYAQFAPVTDTSYVRCYANTANGLGDGFNGSTTSYLSTGPDAPAPQAVEQCATLWRMGIVYPAMRNSESQVG